MEGKSTAAESTEAENAEVLAAGPCWYVKHGHKVAATIVKVRGLGVRT